MTAFLFIAAWLLCGFVGSTLAFYSPWANEVFYNTRQVTICQALFRSLFGPIQILFLIFCAGIELVEKLFKVVHNSSGCNKVIFKRNSK
jgi:hypothetical protein